MPCFPTRNFEWLVINALPTFLHTSVPQQLENWPGSTYGIREAIKKIYIFDSNSKIEFQFFFGQQLLEIRRVLTGFFLSFADAMFQALNWSTFYPTIEFSLFKLD